MKNFCNSGASVVNKATQSMIMEFKISNKEKGFKYIKKIDCATPSDGNIQHCILQSKMIRHGKCFGESILKI